jgi:COP9 signalosome complex subunit 7
VHFINLLDLFHELDLILHQILPYSDLLSSLDCSTIRNLEDLIIDGIYSNVLRARLDQRAQRVEVEYVLGRDVAPENVQKLLASLQDWYICSLSREHR